MISTVFRVALRPLPAHARSLLWKHSGTSVAIPMPLRYASHKSAKASKALKLLKKAETSQPPQPPQPPQLRQQKSITKTSKPKEAVNLETKPQHFSPSPPRYFSLEEQLGSEEGRTLLYRKSNWKLVLVCYIATGVGIWSMFNNHYVHILHPVGSAANLMWVKATYYVVIAIFGVGVAAVFLYPSRLIRSIYAIPYRRSSGSSPSVKLDIRSNNVLSFLPPLKTQATLDEIYLTRSLTESIPPLEEATPEGKLERFTRNLFRPLEILQSVITREKMVPVRVKSLVLDLHIHKDGWQWEKRGLDRLLGSDKKW